MILKLKNKVLKINVEGKMFPSRIHPLLERIDDLRESPIQLKIVHDGYRLLQRL
jgi:hypothetical protein